MNRTYTVIICMLLIITASFSGAISIENQSSTPAMVGHALVPPQRPDTHPLDTTLLPQPGYYETSEYMIGSIAVGVIFVESNGAIDPNTENWIVSEENQVISEINQALSWWAGQNTNAGISFTYDIHTSVPSSYEPIIHPTAGTDNTYEQLWVNDSLGALGYNTGDWMTRTYDYNNALRATKGTDWAFTVFVIDSSADIDGAFSDGWSAYAYIGGPFVVLTYDNGAWGISRMNQVMAHETAHIFWATEEYNSITEYSGYLNAADNDGSGGLMDVNALFLSSGTKQQIGWRDTDADTKQDIIDTEPTTTLDIYTPDPTRDTTLTYYGNTTVTPYPNNNPQPWASGNDVTINTIGAAPYSMDGGYFIPSTPIDGTFDSYTESFTFTVPGVSLGTHTFSARGYNNVGNYDSTPATDTVTVTQNQAPANPTIPNGPASGSVGTDYGFTTSSIDPDGDDIRYGWDWNGDMTIDELTPYYPSGSQINTSHNWTAPGTYMVSVIAIDNYTPAYSGWSTPHTITIQSNLPPAVPNTPNGPTTGGANTAYTFITSSTDPESDDVYYWFDWGDGSDSGWVGPYTSGTTGSALHSWTTSGTYPIRVKAKDINDAESGWSTNHVLTITNNQPPSTPTRPNGPDEGDMDTTYTFITSSTDPESDDIYYWFDWGDGSDSGWVGPYTSGTTGSATHRWTGDGAFLIKVKAKDTNDVESGWSTNHIIQIEGNQAPGQPDRPDGETNGKKGTTYTYSTSATDPDDDQLRYQWDFGDGSTSEWLGPYDSGETVETTYKWDEKGDYSVKVRCKDTNDEISEWSAPLAITMPRIRNIAVPYCLQQLWEFIAMILNAITI